MNKKIVIIDLRAWKWTGIGRVTRGIYDCTQELKSEIDFYYIINADVPELKKDDCLIEFKSKPFGVTEQIEFLRLFKLFKNQDKIILHSLYFNVPLLIPRNISLICNFYDVLSGTNEFRTIFHRIAYDLYVKSLRYNRALILAQSEFTHQQISKHHPFHKVIVCSPGYKNYLTSDDVNIAAVYGISRNYFLYVGLNKPRKNLYGLLLAFRDALHSNPNIDYDLVICGPIFDKIAFGFDIKKFVNSHMHLNNRVHLLGFVPESHLKSLYSNATLYVVPSHLESGYSYPALEALSCGTPVLLNKFDMHGFASENESTYFFDGSEKKGSNSLNNVMKDLLNKSSFKRVSLDRCDVVSRFSWSYVKHTLKSIYLNK